MAPRDEAPRVEESPPPEPERPQAFDVVDRAARVPENIDDDTIIRDMILPRRRPLLVAGEEGDGKTLLAEQVLRQALRGELVLDHFELGAIRPRRVLVIDTEMDEREVDERCRDLDSRGLEPPADSLLWVCASGIDLGRSADDHAYVEGLVAMHEPDIVWIDAATSAVGDPNDGPIVNRFFDWLRTLPVLATPLTLHPRKRAQGEYGRRFDDLFGSRAWKGRSSKALFIDGARIVCWKDAGGHIRRRWPRPPKSRYPEAALLRPGLDDANAAPFRISVEIAAPSIDAADLRSRALELVTDQPDTHSKTSLARELGGRRDDALRVIGQLIAENLIGTNTPGKGAKLRPLQEPLI